MLLVSVSGSSAAIPGVVTLLRSVGYVVGDTLPSYRILLDDYDGTLIHVDIADALTTPGTSSFGRVAVHQIGGLAALGGVFVQVKDGNQDDRAVRVLVPRQAPDEAHAIGTGLMRTLDVVTGKSG